MTRAKDSGVIVIEIKPSNTIADRVAKFYTDNPTEWLSIPDMCAKFGCTQYALASALKGLRRKNLVPLERFSVYRLRPVPA